MKRGSEMNAFKLFYWMNELVFKVLISTFNILMAMWYAYMKWIGKLSNYENGADPYSARVWLCYISLIVEFSISVNMCMPRGC